MTYSGPFIDESTPLPPPRMQLSFAERLGLHKTNYLFPEQTDKLSREQLDLLVFRSSFKRLSCLNKLRSCLQLRRMKKRTIDTANTLWKDGLKSEVKFDSEPPKRTYIPRPPSYVTLPRKILAECFLRDQTGDFLQATASRLRSDPEFALILLDTYNEQTPLDELNGLFTEYVGTFLPDRIKAITLRAVIPDRCNSPVSV